MDARGELVLTDEGLFNYWQQEWVICTDRIHHLETTLADMTEAPWVCWRLQSYGTRMEPWSNT